MASMTLKVTNRSPRHLIKGLPVSVDLGPDATVEDVKKLIARAAKISDFNRVGIFDPSSNKTLKDRLARIVDQPGVISAKEVLVKDLGLQVAWRTVYVIEYFGPILFHVLVVALRPLLYRHGDGPMSRTQWLVFGLFLAHFVKREVETLFVHKFSASTMPVWNILRNSFFYWATAGFLCAVSIYSPGSLAARANQPLVELFGLAIYLFGETANALVHLYLASLRSDGSIERKIPAGYGFGLVTSPNYMYEILSWVGVIIISRDWTVVFFIAIGMFYMHGWGHAKERNYRKQFPDKYKKKRYVMLPGLL